jgi:hypothetical protein
VVVGYPAANHYLACTLSASLTYCRKVWGFVAFAEADDRSQADFRGRAKADPGNRKADALEGTLGPQSYARTAAMSGDAKAVRVMTPLFDDWKCFLFVLREIAGGEGGRPLSGLEAQKRAQAVLIKCGSSWPQRESERGPVLGQLKQQPVSSTHQIKRRGAAG